MLEDEDMFQRRWTFLLAVPALSALLISTSAHALESDARQPIRVQAGNLQLDDKNGTAIYSGAVHIEQGSMKLDAERVELSRNAKGEFTQMKATGTAAKRAYIESLPNPQDGLVRGWANTIIYYNATRRVELVQRAELHRGNDTFTGAYVEYLMNTRQVQAQGGTSKGNGNGRIEMTLSPSAQ